MITINEMIREANKDGYSDEDAVAKVCQDIILKGLSESNLCRNATIKGEMVITELLEEWARVNNPEYSRSLF